MAYLAFPTCFFLNTFTNQHKWMSLHFSLFRIEVCFFLNYFSPNRSMVCGVCLCVWVRFKFMVQSYVIQGRIIALNTLAFVRLSKYMHNEYNMRSLEVFFCTFCRNLLKVREYCPKLSLNVYTFQLYVLLCHHSK